MTALPRPYGGAAPCLPPCGALQGRCALTAAARRCLPPTGTADRP